jgi:hypothetical protein
MTTTNENLVIPPIEDNIPLPKNAAEALPNISVDEEIKMRASTIKLISDINGETLEPTEEHIKEAEKYMQDIQNNPELRPDFDKYPNETMAYLAGMVAQTNVMLVKQYADYKLYVVNNLVKEVETAKSSRDRIAALSKLGDVDGVDAFKKKTEVMHVTKSGKELEEELKKAIEELKGKVIEGEVLENHDDQ